MTGGKVSMKRTTIFADDDLLHEIKEISKEENKSIAEIMREAMQNYIKQKRFKKKKVSFIGIGSSGRKNISERHEELLWKKVTK
jgi:metal-responsive CopG/Arc/MetJ family transcriptional regulator